MFKEIKKDEPFLSVENHFLPLYSYYFKILKVSNCTEMKVFFYM